MNFHAAFLLLLTARELVLTSLAFRSTSIKTAVCAIRRNNGILHGTSSTPKEVRLHKLISRSGFTSLRNAERLIADGRVTVNGIRTTIDSLGSRVTPHKDFIKVDGQTIYVRSPRELMWVLSCKRKGTPTFSGGSNDKSIIDLIPEAKEHGLVPVCGMPRSSTGIEILTNDKEWVHKLCHPSYGHHSTYLLFVEGKLSASAVDTLQAIKQPYFVNNENGKRGPMFELHAVEYIKRLHRTLIELTVQELSHRSIENTLNEMNYTITSIRRTAFGSVTLRETKSGQWRVLTSSDISGLKRMSAKLPM